MCLCIAASMCVYFAAVLYPKSLYICVYKLKRMFILLRFTLCSYCYLAQYTSISFIFIAIPDTIASHCACCSMWDSVLYIQLLLYTVTNERNLNPCTTLNILRGCHVSKTFLCLRFSI